MSNQSPVYGAEEHRSPTSQIAVRVLFFGAARDAVGQAEIVLSLNTPINAGSAFDQVLDAFPALRRFGRSLLFAVNEEYAPPEREVRAGDELAVFPPVSGGCGPDPETGRQGDAETRGRWDKAARAQLTRASRGP